ncbi:PKD domain-containing protein [uncultured Microscilla sp.]|uniref:PKD domain-containing protein n=1 Tax=uncultured Microscilla sp. TaxID=432653 RepID=UPI0026347B83|nr:PKD domain-containing protein [uncultured Microscilla sp.]
MFNYSPTKHRLKLRNLGLTSKKSRLFLLLNCLMIVSSAFVFTPVSAKKINYGIIPANVNLCKGGSATTLPAIVIQEDAVGDFQETTGTLVLAFDNANLILSGSPSVVLTNPSTSTVGASVNTTNNTLEITYNFDNASITQSNTLIINNVQVSANSSFTGSTSDLKVHSSSSGANFTIIDGTTVFATATVTPTPTDPTFTTNPAIICNNGGNVTYTASSTDASTYEWDIPTGLTGTSTSSSINLSSTNTTGTSYTIRVRGVNGSCTSNWTSHTVTLTSTPAIAGTISGGNTIYGGESKTYTVPAITDANNYEWTFPIELTAPSATAVSTTTTTRTVSTTTNNITVTASTVTAATAITSGSMTVRGQNTTCSTYGTASASYPINISPGVSVTAPTLTNLCNGGNAVALGSIVITENHAGAFKQGNQTLTLALPTGFEFNTSASPVATLLNNDGASTLNASVTTTELNLVYNFSTASTTLSNSITITGLEIKATTGSATAVTLKPNNTATATHFDGLNNDVSFASMVSVDPPSTPSFTASPSVTNGSTNVCTGQSYTYTINSVAGVDYEWTFPSGMTVVGGSTTSETITLLVGSGAVSGMVSVRLKNQTSNCTSGWLQESVTVVNSVASAPTINTISDMCEGDSQTITIVPVSGATSYTWDFTWTDGNSNNGNFSGTPASASDNFLAYTASNIFASAPATQNSIEVTLTVKGVSATCGNGATSTQKFNVKRTVVSITNTTTSFSTSSAKEALTASANGTNITTGVFSGPGVSQGSGGTYYFDPSSLGAGSYTVTCTYTDPVTSCVGTATQSFLVSTTNALGLSAGYCDGDNTAYAFKVTKIVSQSITELKYIHSLVTTNGVAVDGSKAGNNAVIANNGSCAGVPSSNTMTNEDFHYTFTPSNAVGTNVNIVANVVTATYDLLGNLTGCNTSTQALGSVTLNPAPMPGITNVTSFNLCADGTTEHTYETASVTNHTYQWEVIPASAGDIIGSSTGNQVKVRWNTASTTHQLKVTEKDAINCDNFDTQTIAVNALPTIDFTGSDGSAGRTALNAACPNTPVTYTATNTGLGSYNWVVSNGTTLSPNTTSSSIQVQWTGTGTGTLSLQVSDGTCTKTVSGDVTINTVSTPSLISTPQTTVCANSKNIGYSASSNCEWTITGGTIVSTGTTTASNTANIAVNWGSSTAGSITIRESAGSCLGDNKTDITITPLATVSFTGLPSTAMVCKTSKLTVNPTINNAAPSTGTTTSEFFVVYDQTATTEIARFEKTDHNGASFEIDFNNPAANTTTHTFAAGKYTLLYEYRDATTAQCQAVSSHQGFTLEAVDNVNFTVAATGLPLANKYCIDGGQLTLNPVFTSTNTTATPATQGYFQIVKDGTTNFNLNAGDNVIDLAKLGGQGSYQVTYIFTSAGGACVQPSATQTFQLNTLPVLGITNINTGGYCTRDGGKVALGATVGGLPHTLALNAGTEFFEIKRAGGTYESLVDPTTGNPTNMFDPTRPLPSEAAIASNANASTWNSIAGTYQIRYTYTDGTTTCKNTSAEYNIVVNALPILDFIGLNSTQSYCNNFGAVTLTPIDNGSIITTPVTFKYRRVGSTGAYTNFTSGNTFNTSTLGEGSFEIMFDYTNGSNCTESSSSQTVTIESVPTGIAVTAERYENQNFIKFSSSATNITTATTWSWTFGDATTSTEQNPVKSWNNPASQLVNYTLSVNTGSANLCENAITKSYSADFSFTGHCLNSPTQFTDLSQSSTDPIATWAWEFGDGVGTSNLQNPSYTYQAAGTYWVKLTITTQDGLGTYILHKRIDIFPINIINESQTYAENFESGTGGWITHGLVTVDQTSIDSTSWKLQTPKGFNITSTNGTSWVTDNSDNANRPASNTYNYNDNEQSYIESPCFDITGLSRPMISFDFWSDTDKGADGIVLLYTIDDGKTWARLGSQNLGIEWYDSKAILGSPGSSYSTDNAANQGWSGNTTQAWRTARFSLTEALQKMNGFTTKMIRFRLAFGSNSDNPTDVNLDGFAFDNITIGNRNRVVLLEYFINEGVTNAGTLDKAAKDFPNTGNSDEIISIHHHTGFPAVDAINAQNTQDPSARAFHHGIREVPRGIIDGYTRDTLLGQWATDYYADRTLIISPFNISIAQPTVSGTQLSVNATITALQSFDRPLVLHVVVIDSAVTSNGVQFYNVTRKMLPDAAGTYHNSPWQTGTTKDLSFTWDFGTLATSGMKVVVFVEDYQTKAIYQAGVSTFVGARTGGTQGLQQVTGLSNQTDELPVRLYPNPATTQMYVALENTPATAIEWQVIAMSGKVVQQGKWLPGSNQKILEVANLSEGMYILRMQDNKRQVFRRFEKK